MSGKLFWQIVLLMVIYAIIMTATKIGLQCAYESMPYMKTQMTGGAAK